MILAPFAQEVWGVGGVLVPMLIASAAAARPGPRGGRGRRDPAARPLRHPRRVLQRVDRPAPRRRRGRHALGRRGRRARDRDRPGRRDGLDLGGRARRVPALPAGAVRRARRRPPSRAAVRRPVDDRVVADSARATLGTALLPTVAPIAEAGYFRNAQAPATGLSALVAPARLVLLTEQTRDFEAGRTPRCTRCSAATSSARRR